MRKLPPKLIRQKKMPPFLFVSFRLLLLGSLFGFSWFSELGSAQSKDLRFPTSVIRQGSKSFPEYDGRNLEEWGRITTYFEDTATIDIRPFLKPIVENEILYFVHRNSQKVIAEGVVESVFENRNYAKIRLLKVKRRTRPSVFQRSVAVRLIQIIPEYQGKASFGNKAFQLRVGGSSNKYQSLDFLLKSNLDKRIVKLHGNLTLFTPYGVVPKALNMFGLRLSYSRALDSKINLKTASTLTNKAELSQVKTSIDLIYSYTRFRKVPELMVYIRAYSNTVDNVTLFDEKPEILDEIELTKQGYTLGGSLSFAVNRTIQIGLDLLLPIKQTLSISSKSDSSESKGEHSIFDKALFLKAQLSPYIDFSTGITHRNEEFIDLDNEIKRSFEDSVAWANFGLLF
ncbi:MAG: hypothetical protein HRU09_11110 [Oligoflexales bacterium]|nr:hypothetical protein [Oligoflexales bacterium]